MSGIKKQKYRKTIIACLLLTAIVPLLILGIYSYHSAKQTVRKNVRQANETVLMQIANKSDNILEGVQRTFFRLAAGSLTDRMIRQEMDHIDYKDLREYIDEIGQNQAYVGYVSDYTLISFEKQWVLSNKGMFSMDEIENPEDVEAIRERWEKIFWINRTQEHRDKEILREHIDNEYLTFVAKVPIYSSDDQAVFIVSLDQASFEKIFRESLSSSSLTVFDEDGKLVFTENQEIAAYYEENQEALKQGTEEGISPGGRQYDIVKHRSSVSGWTFIAGYDPGVIAGELNSILITMGGIILLILVIVGGITIFSTSKVYRPIKELVSSFEGMVEETEEGDEFGLINQGIHQLVGHNEQLQQMIDRQKNQLKELFGLRLIRGTLSEAEILQTRERLQTLDEPWFCVVSAVFCQKAEDGARERMEQDVLNLEMVKNMPEEIRNILLLPPFIYTRAIVMVLGSPTKEKMEQKILALRNCLSVYVTNFCGGYVDMGVSRLFDAVTGFKKGYQESLEALKINEYYGHDQEEGISLEDSSITYYADLIQKSSSAEYNQALDQMVRSAVDSCSREQAFQAVDQFLRDISRNGAVMYEQHFYLYRFLMTILSVPADAGIPIRDMFPEGESNLFSRFNQLYDYNNIRKFYEEQVILPVISHLEQFRKSSSEMVMEKIIQVIRQAGGDITLAECAEKLGYHPSYIWRVMKNTRDITFTDYLAEQKLEMARSLLEETELSVAEIAEKLNYSNAQNFIRLFKKHMDITPGQYRKNRRKEAGQEPDRK